MSAQPIQTPQGLLYPSLTRDTLNGEPIKSGTILSGVYLGHADVRSDHGHTSRMTLLWDGRSFAVSDDKTHRTFEFDLTWLIETAVKAGLTKDVIDFKA